MLPKLRARVIKMYFEKKYYSLKDTILFLSSQFVKKGWGLVPYLLPVCDMSETWA